MSSGSDGQKDFDFFMGSWKVRNRRLRERLASCADWDEFAGTAVARPIWGGLANVDEYEGDAPFGLIHGMTVRLYEPATRQWRLYWANRTAGIFDVPMVGRFEDGRGEFYNQELHAGQAVYARFVWSNITPTTCRWEQALSTDGGRSWETNWIMEMTRWER
jgi:hypothetical protein